MWTRRRRVVLVGDLDEMRVNELRRLCRELAEQGWRRVMIDASGVSGCDRSGLLGLHELAHRGAAPEIEIAGVRWSQFSPALQATPLTELTAAHRRIRDLLAAGRPGPDHPGPPDDAAPRGSVGTGAVPAPRGRHRRHPVQAGRPAT